MEKTLDILKTEAEIANLMAETAKLNAEARKFGREANWYPLVALAAGVGALVGALVSATKIFH